MKKYIIALLLLSSCATPITVMKKGEDVITCGGGTAGSYFGVTGYVIQQSNDHDCVQEYTLKGYKVTDYKK